MDIRCIALDLDRTTLRSDGTLSPANRAALARAAAKGVHVVIASGRAFATLPQTVLDVPGIEYAVTSNGAAVYHIPTARCLHRTLLRPGSVDRILALTAGEPVAYEGFVDGRAYAAADYVRDPEKYGAAPEAVAYVRRTRTLVEDMAGFLRAHRDCLDSLDVVTRDGADRERIHAYLAAADPDIYLTSSVRQLLEISHRDAGKHRGAAWILAHLGIPREALAAFGDGDNDADLLAFAGCGIAMANASPACRAAADAVTASNDEDGVARGITELLGL